MGSDVTVARDRPLVGMVQDERVETPATPAATTTAAADDDEDDDDEDDDDKDEEDQDADDLALVVVSGYSTSSSPLPTSKRRSEGVLHVVAAYSTKMRSARQPTASTCRRWA